MKDLNEPIPIDSRVAESSSRIHSSFSRFMIKFVVYGHIVLSALSISMKLRRENAYFCAVSLCV